ncbi:serine hydrolase [Nonomuraea diastatica]|uniref:serine hydrolase n=1 Tax=Nonomuraea diastatica TaxID=1848329 RepID=UPI00140C658D|nr:serine hydrolase [Nonomuraea diastatica]
MSQAVPAQATAAPISASATSAPEIPATPAGKQLGWLIDASSRAPIPEDELKKHFSASFLKGVPADQINQVLTGFKDMRLTKIVQSRETALVALVQAAGTAYEVVLSVDGAGLIGGLQFRPPAPKSWSELDKRLRKAATQTGFLAAEVKKNGDCRPLHTVAGDKVRPLGSMVKLYVLGAVAQRIKSGAFGWDTEITITPELKSLPSGQLQDRPDGSKVTVLEAAKLMISISDNTATDLLIHQVGRKTVERTIRAWGNPDKRNAPLLTTRELFVLKGADYPRHAKRYLSLSTAKKRDYLEKVVAKVPLDTIAAWDKPRELDTIEYFGSPSDICQAYARLAKMPDKHVNEAMSINDAGLGLPAKQWPTVWYKGGSEPGVHDQSFLARTSGGKTYVVTAMAVNPKAVLDDGALGLELTALARGAFTLSSSS